MGECRNNSLCIFCRKPASALDGSHEGNYSLQFLQLFSRFLEIPLKIPEKNQDLVSCDDCFLMGESFRDEYFEWENLRLQLEWRVREVFEIMRAAGKVPSDQSKTRNDGDDESNKVYDVIQTLRKEILKGCKKKLDTSNTRVVLETIKEEIVQNVSVPAQIFKNFEIMKQMMTFTAVFTLSLPHAATNNDKTDCATPTAATIPSVETNFKPMDVEVHNCVGEVSETRDETQVPNSCNDVQADAHVQQHDDDSDGEVYEELQIEEEMMTHQKDSTFNLELISDAIAFDATEAIPVLNPDTVSPVAEKCCYICQLTFSTPVLLTFHLNSIHHLRVPFECPQCGLKCPQIGIFRWHMRKAHKTVTGLPGPVHCDICMERFESDTSVKRHKSRVHKSQQHSPLETSLTRRPTSKVCWAKPKIILPLIRRQRQTAPVRGILNQVGIKCPTCQFSWKNHKALVTHMRLLHHQKITGYNCAHCSTSLKTLEGFRAHMHISHEKKFETTSALLSAENIRFSSTEQHSSEYVGNEIQNGSPSSLPQNLSNDQEPQPGPSTMSEAADETGNIPEIPNLYSCEWNWCPEKFARMTQLKLHYKNHSTAATFRCKFCKLAFSGSTHLSHHLKIHGKRGHYTCNINGCLKSYSTQNYLKVHQQIHLDQKHFKCGWEYCSRKFATKRGLQLHHKVHTKQTPLRCQLSFASPLRLKLHRGSHHRVPVEGGIPNNISISSNGETVDAKAEKTLSPTKSRGPGRKRKTTLVKNYKCNFGGVCDESFASVGAWKSHQRVHKEVKSQFKLKACSFNFGGVEELQRHYYLQKHKAQQPPNRNHDPQQLEAIVYPASNENVALHPDSVERVAEQRPETPIWSNIPRIALPLIRRGPTASLRESVNPVGATPPQHLNSQQPATSTSTMIATLDNFASEESREDIALDCNTDEGVTPQEPETDNWECVSCQATFDQASQLSDHIREEHGSQLAHNSQANEEESELVEMKIEIILDSEAGEDESESVQLNESSTSPPRQLYPRMNIAASIPTIPEQSPAPHEPETDNWEDVTCQATFDLPSQLNDHIRAERVPQGTQNSQSNEEERELEEMEVEMSQENKEDAEFQYVELGLSETPPTPTGQLDPGMNVAASIPTIPEQSPTPQLQSGMEVEDNLYFICAHCHFETGDREELQAHFETHTPRVGNETTEEDTFVAPLMEADADENVLKDDDPEIQIPASGAPESHPISSP